MKKKVSLSKMFSKDAGIEDKKRLGMIILRSHLGVIADVSTKGMSAVTLDEVYYRINKIRNYTSLSAIVLEHIGSLIAKGKTKKIVKEKKHDTRKKAKVNGKRKHTRKPTFTETGTSV